MTDLDPLDHARFVSRKALHEERLRRFEATTTALYQACFTTIALAVSTASTSIFIDSALSAAFMLLVAAVMISVEWQSAWEAKLAEYREYIEFLKSME